MTKCDFCTKSDPSGKCYWTLASCRENDCKNAIKLMIQVLQCVGSDNKKHSK